LLGLDLSDWVSQDFTLPKLGPIAEQLVAQEFIAYSSPKKSPELYYWHREAKQSNAEVDFLFKKKQQVVPAYSKRLSFRYFGHRNFCPGESKKILV